MTFATSQCGQSPASLESGVGKGSGLAIEGEIQYSLRGGGEGGRREKGEGKREKGKGRRTGRRGVGEWGSGGVGTPNP
jgi:hypothetical protein